MKKINLFLIIAVFAVVCLFISCSLEDDTMSIADRVDNFVDDLNGGRADAYKNLHPDCGMYNQLKSAAAWDSIFPAGTYDVDGSKSGSSYTGTITGGSYIGDTIVFSMKEDGEDNWKILRISINGTNKIY